MSGELSVGVGALRKRLDEAVVLQATVAQLAKDLDVADLRTPPTGQEAFEAVRAQVLTALERMQAGSGSGLSRAVNRVDLTEVQVNDALGRGGLVELAGLMVLRCLQKVLIREHYAGRA
ncbi:MAG: hypothetical protein U0U25_12885 [Flavobacteriales bacterium]